MGFSLSDTLGKVEDAVRDVRDDLSLDKLGFDSDSFGGQIFITAFNPFNEASYLRPAWENPFIRGALIAGAAAFTGGLAAGLAPAGLGAVGAKAAGVLGGAVGGAAAGAAGDTLGNIDVNSESLTGDAVTGAMAGAFSSPKPSANTGASAGLDLSNVSMDDVITGAGGTPQSSGLNLSGDLGPGLKIEPGQIAKAMDTGGGGTLQGLLSKAKGYVMDNPGVALQMVGQGASAISQNQLQREALEQRERERQAEQFASILNNFLSQRQSSTGGFGALAESLLAQQQQRNIGLSGLTFRG